MKIDKYNHQIVESNIYKYWESNKLFKPKKNTKSRPLLAESMPDDKFSIEKTFK